MNFVKTPLNSVPNHHRTELFSGVSLKRLRLLRVWLFSKLVCLKTAPVLNLVVGLTVWNDVNGIKKQISLKSELFIQRHISKKETNFTRTRLLVYSTIPSITEKQKNKKLSKSRPSNKIWSTKPESRSGPHSPNRLPFNLCFLLWKLASIFLFWDKNFTVHRFLVSLDVIAIQIKNRLRQILMKNWVRYIPLFKLGHTNNFNRGKYRRFVSYQILFLAFLDVKWYRTPRWNRTHWIVPCRQISQWHFRNYPHKNLPTVIFFRLM